MASTASFTKFVYASDQSKYTSYTSKSNNDIAFVGGSSAATTSPTQNTSGIWAQGVFFPTPYAANDLYTKSQVYTKTETDNAYVKKTSVGVASGVASLGSDGKVPASQLPSYVDDVKEFGDITTSTISTWGGGIYTVTSASQIIYNTVAGRFFAYNATSGYFKQWTSTNSLLTMDAYGSYDSTTGGATPTTDKIYVALDDNKCYRYSGSALTEISAGALSDAEASTLLNQYIKTISNGTATAVTNAAEIEVVTGAGTKTNSTTKGGATQTLARSKAATKTYVDKMSPSVLIRDVASLTEMTDTSYILEVSHTAGDISTQARTQFERYQFQPLTLQVNGTTKTTYTPNASRTLNLTSADFVSWTIL